MPGLILVPTQLELGVIDHTLRPLATENQMHIELCGCGPIAAAARSATLVARLRPERVVLLGLAGGFGDSHPIGSATTFDQVHCWGVGAGSARHSKPLRRWAFEKYNDCIVLSPPSDRTAVLLTCCSASASEQEAEQKRTAIPAATAEDMEGFGVALSCQLAGVPLTIIRGISNRVGDRNKALWEIESALHAAVALAADEVTKQP